MLMVVNQRERVEQEESCGQALSRHSMTAGRSHGLATARNLLRALPHRHWGGAYSGQVEGQRALAAPTRISPAATTQ
jgi:hypothetical protein